MFREYNIVFSIRKGLSAEWVDKGIAIGLDDLPDDEGMSEGDIRKMAIDHAEALLYESDDFPLYGKNWVFKEIYES